MLHVQWKKVVPLPMLIQNTSPHVYCLLLSISCVLMLPYSHIFWSNCCNRALLSNNFLAFGTFCRSPSRSPSPATSPPREKSASKSPVKSRSLSRSPSPVKSEWRWMHLKPARNYFMICGAEFRKAVDCGLWFICFCVTIVVTFQKREPCYFTVAWSCRNICQKDCFTCLAFYLPSPIYQTS